MQAPFVLRLSGPPAVPGPGPLQLVAELSSPATGLAAPLRVEVEVQAPAGVSAGQSLQTSVELSATTPRVSLPLSFTLSGPLSQPIVVRASLRVGDVFGAVAQRQYPPPPEKTHGNPAGSTPAPEIPGLPVANP